MNENCKERINQALLKTGEWTRKPVVNWAVNGQPSGRKYTGEMIGRRLRELANEGKIEKRYVKGCVQYRIKIGGVN